jgi:hypothetical protein
MRAYYDRRAAEYDDWWLGTGKFAKRDRPGWHEELTATLAALPHAHVVQGDAVPLPFPDGEFDRVHSGHFYGHLLGDERAAFLREARRVGRRIVVVDSARRDDTGAEEWQERVLNDGSRHQVYKRFFTGADLAAEVGGEVLHAGRWFVAAGDVA